jgi:hypothetical protein
MKTIAKTTLLMLLFLVSCSKNKKIDEKFNFSIQSIYYTVDTKRNIYTVHTLKGDTTTNLNLTAKDLYRIQRILLSKGLHEFPHNFNPKHDNNIMGESGTKVFFEHSNSMYSFLIFNHDRYNFFNRIKVKKIEEFLNEVQIIIGEKQHIRRMPKSDSFSM